MLIRFAAIKVGQQFNLQGDLSKTFVRIDNIMASCCTVGKNAKNINDGNEKILVTQDTEVEIQI